MIFKIFKLFLIIVLFTFCNCVSNKIVVKPLPEENKNVIQEDTVIYTPSRLSYFLDDTQVTEKFFYEKHSTGEIESSGHIYWDQQEVIRLFGEKYRYGIVFFKSKRHEVEKK